MARIHRCFLPSRPLFSTLLCSSSFRTDHSARDRSPRWGRGVDPGRSPPRYTRWGGASAPLSGLARNRSDARCWRLPRLSFSRRARLAPRRRRALVTSRSSSSIGATPLAFVSRGFVHASPSSRSPWTAGVLYIWRRRSSGRDHPSSKSTKKLGAVGRRNPNRRLRSGRAAAGAARRWLHRHDRGAHDVRLRGPQVVHVRRGWGGDDCAQPRHGVGVSAVSAVSVSAVVAPAATMCTAVSPLPSARAKRVTAARAATGGCTCRCEHGSCTNPGAARAAGWSAGRAAPSAFRKSLLRPLTKLHVSEGWFGDGCDTPRVNKVASTAIVSPPGRTDVTVGSTCSVGVDAVRWR